MFITWFQLAMYECYCRFLLCVSSQPRSCMYVIVEKNQSILFYYVLLASHDQINICTFFSKRSSQFCIMCFQLNTTMHIISQEVRSISYQVFLAKHDHAYIYYPRGSVNYQICISRQPRPCMSVIVLALQSIFIM